MAENDIELLPGVPAMTLLRRGVWLEFAGAATSLLSLFGSRLPRGPLGDVAPIVAIVLLVGTGGIVGFTAYRKADREVGQGYTTIPQRAVQNPALYQVDRRDMTVLAVPGSTVGRGKIPRRK